LLIILIPLLFSCSSVEKIDLEKGSIESGLILRTTGEDGTVKIFLGIPYAAPPVGDLRWKAPQPPPEWAISVHFIQMRYHMSSITILLSGPL